MKYNDYAKYNQENVNLYNSEVKEETIESLKAELREAKAEIQRLKEALGSNHPLGIRRGIF